MTDGVRERDSNQEMPRLRIIARFLVFGASHHCCPYWRLQGCQWVHCGVVAVVVVVHLSDLTLMMSVVDQNHPGDFHIL